MSKFSHLVITIIFFIFITFIPLDFVQANNFNPIRISVISVSCSIKYVDVDHSGSLTIKEASVNEASIFIEGNECSNGETIYLVVDFDDAYRLTASFDPSYFSFLMWPHITKDEDTHVKRYMKENYLVVYDRRSQNTLVEFKDISIPYRYSISLLLIKNNITPRDGSVIETGSLAFRYSIHNSVNNETNSRFYPYESVKIYTEAVISMPVARNADLIYVEWLSGLDLLKYERNVYSIANLTAIETYENLGRSITISHVYPEDRYLIGFSSREGITYAFSYSYAVWRVGGFSSFTDKITVKALLISNILPKPVKMVDLENNYNFTFSLRWEHDNEPVINKTGLFSLYIKELGITQGENNAAGFLKNIMVSKNFFKSLNGTLTFMVQLKNGGIIQGSYNLIDWHRLASIVLYNDFNMLRIKVIKIEDGSPVTNVKIDLLIDGQVVQSSFTDDQGIAVFSLPASYNSISIVVREVLSNTLLLSSEYSNLLIYSKTSRINPSLTMSMDYASMLIFSFCFLGLLVFLKRRWASR